MHSSSVAWMTTDISPTIYTRREYNTHAALTCGSGLIYMCARVWLGCSGPEPTEAERLAHKAKARGLSSTVMAGADLEKFKAVAQERQGRNVAAHVARDSSAYAEFLEPGDGEAEGPAGQEKAAGGDGRAKL